MNNHRKPIHVKSRAGALAIVNEHQESAWFYIEDERDTKYIVHPRGNSAKPSSPDFIEIYGNENAKNIGV